MQHCLSLRHLGHHFRPRAGKYVFGKFTSARVNTTTKATTQANSLLKTLDTPVAELQPRCLHTAVPYSFADTECEAFSAPTVAPSRAAMEGPGFQLVVAVARNMGIGKDGNLPWKLSGDMKYFRELTSRTRESSRQNAVIMGRKTWESLPQSFRPLKDRVNIVLSRSVQTQQHDDTVMTDRDNNSPAAVAVNKGKSGEIICPSLEAAMDLLSSEEMKSKVETVFVIGGGQVYHEAMQSPLCKAIHITRVEKDVECDTFFPEIDTKRFRLWSAGQPITENDTQYTFMTYTPNSQAPVALPPVAMPHEEQQYLDLVDTLIKTGVFRPDRTGTGTWSKFGCTMRFNLRHSFPLLTSKRVFWRGVVEELLWFVKGCTNAKDLQAKDIHIWDGNSSREYLDSIGLKDREEGDLGPVYGFQWRHFGAQYTNMHADYDGQGVDQLADVIRRLKTNPYDRRIIMTAWNPAALHLMALPPCHMFCQFYVANGELSCLMYQRSCDVGLGVPFNIASYSLLTRMIAQVCDLQPGEFVHMMGDTHVYDNHVEPLKEQLKNQPRPFPVLRINPAKKDIDSFVLEDFELEGYMPHKKIEMKMAV